MIRTPETSEGWPRRAHADAFAGIIGEFVLSIEEQTEADPHSLLLHGLTMFGNIVGRDAFFRVARTDHHPNLFAVIVGETSSGRKGMAKDIARSLMRHADPLWPGIVAGLQSGEGLIHAVRDPSSQFARPKKGDHDAKPNPVDPGVADKRLMVVESEFGAVLQIIKRPGNILSAVLRQAWDGETLQVTSRNTAAKATEAHISILGHITFDELMHHLDDVDAYNGLWNRFVWVVARRSRRLPEGGDIDDKDVDLFRGRVRRAVRSAQGAGALSKSSKARHLWNEVYDRLTTDERGGLLGAITARAAPVVLRLATCYALLDCSSNIQVKHLKSALALWDYCDASARHIFGARVGQQDADRLLRELRTRRSEGLTRSEIFNDIFQRRRQREDIGRALQLLASKGLARSTTRATKGRPEERWFAI